MNWFLFRKTSFSFVVFEYKDGALLKKISFHDDRGLTAQQLIDDSLNADDFDRSTIQQIVVQCKAVAFR